MKAKGDLASHMGPNHGDDLVWRRLRAWLGALGSLALVATLAASWWTTRAGGEATLSIASPVVVATLGIIWISGVVHGRRVILLLFSLGYILLAISLVGEPTVWRVVGFALFTGGQIWNLAALWGASPLPNPKSLHRREG